MRSVKRSIIFGVNLEERLRVMTYGAKFGRARADDKMSAISALPNLNARLLEDLLRLDIL